MKALMYHNVSIPPKEANLKSLYTKPSLFESQVKLLKKLGYKSMTSKGLKAFLEGKIKDEKYIIFTFDDAYVDVFENALPILKKYDFSAIIFVPAGLVGKYNEWDADKLNIKKQIASWDYIKSALKDGFEIGSHTITHKALTHIDTKSQIHEIKDSKNILEDKLGISIDTFCYPYGDYNDYVVNIVKDIYALAFSVDSGHIKTHDNPYTLKRLHMRHNTNLFRLLIKLSKLYA